MPSGKGAMQGTPFPVARTEGDGADITKIVSEEKPYQMRLVAKSTAPGDRATRLSRNTRHLLVSHMSKSSPTGTRPAWGPGKAPIIQQPFGGHLEVSVLSSSFFFRNSKQRQENKKKRCCSLAAASCNRYLVRR